MESNDELKYCFKGGLIPLVRNSKQIDQEIDQLRFWSNFDSGNLREVIKESQDSY